MKHIQRYLLNKPEDATAGVKPATVFFIRKVLDVRWLFSLRFDLGRGWSSSPWIELGDWTRFLYNNYNFTKATILGTFLRRYFPLQPSVESCAQY